MTNHSLLKPALVVLGIVFMGIAFSGTMSTGTAAQAEESKSAPASDATFDGQWLDVKTLAGVATLEDAGIRSLGGRKFMVGRLVAHSTATNYPFAGTRIWIPISEVLEIIERPSSQPPGVVGVSTKKPARQIEVEWNGTWWSAEIIETKDGKFHIHYTNYDDTWNEWVGKERIRSAPRQAMDLKNVEVEWGSTWWAAEVLGVKDGKYRVHFKGPDGHRDESVSKDRLREKTVEGNSAETK